MKSTKGNSVFFVFPCFFVLEIGNVSYLCIRMKTLHIFNPEHDIALASDLSNFTAPRAGRKLRIDLAFLPALWSGEDDVVLVDDAEQALVGYRRLLPDASVRARFVTKEQLSHLDIQRVEPWGWDRALRAQLLRYGVDSVPSEDYITMVRQLSHRRTAAQLLPSLRIDGTVGEAVECSTLQQVEACLTRWGQVVVKAPWSSSGRGVHFSVHQGWVCNVLKQQGSVMVEPFYERVMDFGMEFTADASTGIRYDGLSLFHTVRGAYVGNIVATEAVKQQMLCRYLPEGLLGQGRQLIVANLRLAGYCGPFGVDMMVVASDSGYLLHPCVEINLRRTMGHVALTLSTGTENECRVMRIAYDGDAYNMSVEPFHAE